MAGDEDTRRIPPNADCDDDDDDNDEDDDDDNDDDDEVDDDGVDDDDEESSDRSAADDTDVGNDRVKWAHGERRQWTHKQHGVAAAAAAAED